MANKLTGEQVLEMQSKGLNINEIQTLATQNGYEMPDNRNFTEKIAPVLDMVFGGGKVGEAIGTQIAKARATSEERQFIESGPSGGEIAGSVLQSGSLFTPVGKIAGGLTAGARALGMSRGVSALGKIGAGATAGGAFDVAQKMQGRDSGGMGTVIGAAIPTAGVGLNVFGRVAEKITPKLLSYTSDIPERAFTAMLSRRQPVAQAIKGGSTAEQALIETQGAVRQLRTTLSQEWDDATKSIYDEFTGKRWGMGDNASKLALKVSGDFGLELPSNLKNISVKESLDLLKEVNELYSKRAVKESAQGIGVRKFKTILQESITKQFGGDKGSVAQLYKNYSAKKGVLDAANDIVMAYSTGKPIQQARALGRLKTLFNENKSAYLDAILDLEKATGRDLLSKITAVQFSGKMPRALGIGGRDVLDKALRIIILPLSSPRSAAFIARTLGKVKSPNMPKGISPGDRLLQTKANTMIDSISK